MKATCYRCGQIGNDEYMRVTNHGARHLKCPTREEMARELEEQRRAADREYDEDQRTSWNAWVNGWDD